MLLDDRLTALERGERRPRPLRFRIGGFQIHRTDQSCARNSPRKTTEQLVGKGEIRQPGAPDQTLASAKQLRKFHGQFSVHKQSLVEG